MGLGGGIKTKTFRVGGGGKCSGITHFIVFYFRYLCSYLLSNHAEHLSDSTLNCDANMSANRPLQQEQGDEQSSIAGCCEGNNHCDFQIDPSVQEPLFTSPSVVGRRWHKLRARKCHYQQRSQNFRFVVVSYNVLADGLLHANSHLYSGTESWVQQWEYRRRNLLQEILHYNADVSSLL